MKKISGFVWGVLIIVSIGFIISYVFFTIRESIQISERKRMLIIGEWSYEFYGDTVLDFPSIGTFTFNDDSSFELNYDNGLFLAGKYEFTLGEWPEHGPFVVRLICNDVNIMYLWVSYISSGVYETTLTINIIIDEYNNEFVGYHLYGVFVRDNFN